MTFVILSFFLALFTLSAANFIVEKEPPEHVFFTIFLAALAAIALVYLDSGKLGALRCH